MYPQDAQTLQALGALAERLLRGKQEWVVRRKESIAFAGDRVVRRTMSIDYDLPHTLDAAEHSAAGAPIYYAPLFFLQKGSDELPAPGPIMVEPEALFAAFDLRSADGQAMSLPPRSWNASVSIEAMNSAMRNAAGELDVQITATDAHYAHRVLEQIACSARNESVKLLEVLIGGTQIPAELSVLRTLLKEDPTFRWLAAACAESSVVMVSLVGKESLQGIVKLAFDQEVQTPPRWSILAEGAGLRGYDVWFDTPYIGGRTHHVELAAPDGVEIYEAGLIPVASTGTSATEPATLQRRSGFANQVHLYVDDAREQHGALTWIRFRAQRRGFIGVAAMVSVLVTGILWLAYVLAHTVHTSPSGVPELLLLFPGLIAGYVARPGSHPFTTRLLFLARTTFWVLSATPFVAAAALALVPRKNGVLVDERFKPWWLGAAIVASICTLWLITAWILPQPLLRRQQFRRATAALVQKIKGPASRLGARLLGRRG
jgi:hypothetical protein